MPNEKRPGAKQAGAGSIAYEKWISDPKKYATREQVVAFHNLRLNEQVVPLVADIIRNSLTRYDQIQRERRWYRRFARWVKAFFVHKPIAVADLPEEARADLREQLDAVDSRTREPSLGGEETVSDGQGEREVIPTCVNCGSANLGPVNDLGGVKCNKCGAVKEEPPADPNIAGHIGGPLGSEGAGDSTKE